jgi:DNA modification methylase
MNKIFHGNSLEVLKSLEDNSVDAVVCDPPYELGFMGKSWDNSGIAYSVPLWCEALRVLKPGGYLLAFGGTRTYHRMAVAIEDAGFEIRDMIEWIYASGFPKSLNIGKAVDAKLGNEREVVGKSNGASKLMEDRPWSDNPEKAMKISITKGSSPYEGQGSAIKPAHEPICMARKPLSEKTIVDNVLKHGTGGLNIDACRIPSDEVITNHSRGKESAISKGKYGDSKAQETHQTEGQQLGRFPANILCTDDALNDGTISKGALAPVKSGQKGFGGEIYNKYKSGGDDGKSFYSDKENSTNPSRYFNIDIWAERNGILQFPKPAKTEKNNGLEDFKPQAKCEINKMGGAGNTMKTGSGNDRNVNYLNHHPTVKGLNLMSYLVSLVSKEGDTVLDPFAGSGTTLIAAHILKREYIGIELNKDYICIAESRLKYYAEQRANKELQTKMFE